MAYTEKKGDPDVLKKYRKIPRCIFCGRYEGKPFRDHLVCDECLDYIKEMFKDI